MASFLFFEKLSTAGVKKYSEEQNKQNSVINKNQLEEKTNVSAYSNFELKNDLKEITVLIESLEETKLEENQKKYVDKINFLLENTINRIGNWLLA